MNKKNKKDKDSFRPKKGLDLADLGPVTQSPGLCGPTALKVVLEYYGLTASEKELAKLSCASKDEGATAQGIIKAAKTFGLQALLKDNSSIADIAYFAGRNIPVIVDWFYEDDGHYSVVSRLDDKRIFLINSSSKISQAKEIRMTLEKFSRVWFDFPGPFIKKKGDIVLRRMIVLTPFREKFPIAGSRIK